MWHLSLILSLLGYQGCRCDGGVPKGRGCECGRHVGAGEEGIGVAQVRGCERNRDVVAGKEVIVILSKKYIISNFGTRFLTCVIFHVLRFFLRVSLHQHCT